MYTISKFKEFQQELTTIVYCDIINSVRFVCEISESYGQGKKMSFEVVFEETKCEVSYICSKFQFRGILCRHALIVLNYFLKYTSYQSGGKIWEDSIVRWKLGMVCKVCPFSKRDMRKCVLISLRL